MYNVNRDGDYVTITKATSQLASSTGEVPDSGGQIVYRALKTDIIIIAGHAREVGSILSNKDLIQGLHDGGVLG